MSTFVLAAVQALKDQPAVNAVIDGKEMVYKDYCDVTIAVASPTGLVTPVLRNCETKSMADIEKEILYFGKKAKDVIHQCFDTTFSSQSNLGYVFRMSQIIRSEI